MEFYLLGKFLIIQFLLLLMDYSGFLILLESFQNFVSFKEFAHFFNVIIFIDEVIYNIFINLLMSAESVIKFL